MKGDGTELSFSFASYYGSTNKPSKTGFSFASYYGAGKQAGSDQKAQYNALLTTPSAQPTAGIGASQNLPLGEGAPQGRMRVGQQSAAAPATPAEQTIRSSQSSGETVKTAGASPLPTPSAQPTTPAVGDAAPRSPCRTAIPVPPQGRSANGAAAEKTGSLASATGGGRRFFVPAAQAAKSPGTDANTPETSDSAADRTEKTTAPAAKSDPQALRRELAEVEKQLFAMGMDAPYGPEAEATEAGQTLLNRKAALEAEIAETEKALADPADGEPVETGEKTEVDSAARRKYTGNEEENALHVGYRTSIEQGKLSPIVSFELYKRYYEEIQTMTGMKVGNTEITGQSQHFLERVFGCARDPKTGKPRNGVAIEDVLDCLKNPVEIWPVRESQNGKSFVVVGKRAKISVNPDTGKLIQINPRR